MKGIILKGIGGFYYVQTGSGLVECKAKGIFRKEKVTPVAGDWVEITCMDAENGVIDEILPRKNEWARPPLANLDQLVLVVSSCEPSPNVLNLDKLIAAAEYKEIEPIIAITKTDLEPAKKLMEVYKQSGFTVISLNTLDSDSGAVLLPALKGKATALAGNSGVGKSSLLNNLFGFELETAEISQKLGRGRHTTRQVELFPLKDGGYVADTPGFSTIDLHKYVMIKKEELAGCFREFSPYTADCQYSDCSHTTEAGCAVLEALQEGLIPHSRHDSYCRLYEDAKQIKEWENK